MLEGMSEEESREHLRKQPFYVELLPIIGDVSALTPENKLELAIKVIKLLKAFASQSLIICTESQMEAMMKAADVAKYLAVTTELLEEETGLPLDEAMDLIRMEERAEKIELLTKAEEDGGPFAFLAKLFRSRLKEEGKPDISSENEVNGADSLD